jgi:hypothetical protein
MPKRVVAALPPLTGPFLLDEPLQNVPAAPWAVSRSAWTARDGGVWGAQKGPPNRGASLAVPVAFTNGTVDYEVCFAGADRHSLRIEWADGARAGSFRVVISRHAVEVAKNPGKGEGADAVEPLARKALSLEKRQWYPVRITVAGDTATVQVNDTVVHATHAVIAEPKRALTFLVFGESAGFRNVRVVK